MAEHVSDYTPGQMDIRQNEAAFGLFVLMTKWGSLAVSVLVLFFALWFCTGAGFLGAFVTAVVLAAIGVTVLRAKPDAPAH